LRLGCADTCHALVKSERRVPECETLVFDGDCGFCTSWANWAVRHWSDEATAVPWQELGDQGLRELGLTEEQAKVAVWWVEPGGRVTGAEQAVAKALIACRRPWNWIGAAMLVPVGRWLSRLLYPAIARHRHLLPGGSPACRTEPWPGADDGTRRPDHRTRR
jgi:predicted DCC family thiol-disulfide oxidoreductase YuxK